MPLYGEALAERREICGFETASDMARRSKEIVAELADPQFQAFSQQTLSRLEGDKTGEFIANARPRIQRTISCLLGWRAEEFQARIGVGIPHVPFILNAEGELVPVDPAAVITVAAPEAEPRHGNGSPIPPVVPFRNTTVSIPDELQRMADNNADRYPELQEPRILRMLAAPRQEGGADSMPQTEDEWLEYWLITRRWYR